MKQQLSARLNKNHNGSEKAWMITSICLIVTIAGLIILAVWLYVNYDDQKTNVDGKVAESVAVAKKEQADDDEAKFTEREKEPNYEFAGPEDYGTVSFKYPKTWSVYVAKDGSSGGTYEAYLNPLKVPTVSTSQQFALRVLIESKDYNSVIASYDNLVKKGKLSTSSVKVGELSGTRLDGYFSDDIRGSAVLFKIRDKTLTIRTDAMTFKTDFENIINSITFVQ